MPSHLSRPPEPQVPPPRPKNAPQLLRGMKDVLPGDQPWYQRVWRTFRDVVESYGFSRIDTPILEMTSLFNRTVGNDTDIVSKEMYTFQDRGGDSVSLRPEGTAGVVRSYLEHGMVSWPHPVKLWYGGPMFRYDRPQAARYRQHLHLGVESFGEASPVADIQLIAVTVDIFRALNLPVTALVNSLGDAQCRPAYVRKLTEYYKAHRKELCETDQKRLTANPLRLLDCKEPTCQELIADAPQLVDHLCEPCRQHFVQVLEGLDELELPYTLAPKLVRGQDYYTRTVFELKPTEDLTAGTLAGGGRYDRLIEQLGGQPTVALGFGLGVERVVLALKERGLPGDETPHPDVFIAQLGVEARRKALVLFHQLRREGVRPAEAFSKDGLKQQLEVANRVRASYALIIGHKELMDGTIMLRDMENGIQEVIDFQKVIPEVKKRLARGANNGYGPTAEVSKTA